jgi:subtilisin family serine protease
MKKILLLLAALIISFNCYCQAFSKIDLPLQDEMQLRNDDELIKINIIMKDQYDQLELRSKADLYRSKEDKRSFVVNELQRFAVERQQEVMSYLSFFAQNSMVNEITQFWIYNGITCYANKEVITQLSYMDDVLLIGFDKEQNWLPTDEKPYPADDSKEMTYNVTKVQANIVWTLGYTGEGIIVAVVDSGVNYNHNDLKTHMWEDPDYPNHGWNYVGNNDNPMDDHGHGTHCAGTVAGDGTSGSQTGMAPNATIMALKVMNAQGQGNPSHIVSGMQFAVAHGASIISMSLGVSGGGDNATRTTFRNTMINVLEAGVVASVAAGNDGSFPGSFLYPVPNNVGCPGNCPPPWLHPDQTTTGGTSAVVCIGATNSSDAIASFSSKGPVTWQAVPAFADYPYNPGMGLIRPDVCAPGVGIKSCTYNNNSGYTNMDGTSMATPCVAGVMALMLSKNPYLTPAEICEILETTAVHLPNATSPKGNSFGSGRVNALAAIDVIVGCGAPISNLAYTLSYDKIANITWNRPVNDATLLGYTIYLDGVEIPGMITEESFTLQTPEEGDFVFCVVAEHEIDDEPCSAALVCKNIHITSICDAVTALSANVDVNTVSLSWTAPAHPEVLQYNIYRNNVFVTAVATESFSETMDAGNYTYAVEAKYSNECTSDKISVNVHILAAPANLTATNSETEFAIEISWEYDDGSAVFNLFRDDNIFVENIAAKQYIDYEISGCIINCYYVKAVVNELVSAASNEDCAGFVGIKEFNNNLKVYPNPASGEITVTSDELQVTSIDIYDVYGKNVSSHHLILASSHQINVSHLPSGNYVLSVSYVDGLTENVKVVISR